MGNFHKYWTIYQKMIDYFVDLCAIMLILGTLSLERFSTNYFAMLYFWPDKGGLTTKIKKFLSL